MKFIDLFCGIGSFHYSFKRLGFECVMACDINDDARNTYYTNHGIMPRGTICDIDPATVKPYDILCAGFPCQAFSQAGKQKGFSDERGNLFFQILKFVEYHHPSFIVLENVPSLRTHDNGNTFKVILEHLHNSGYQTQHTVLKCSDYGIPQMRKRLFIVGIRSPTQSTTNILDMNPFIKHVSLSQYLGKPFVKETAYTIRCGGRRSHVDNRHNWDSYYLEDGSVYTLTLDDALSLQGFEPSFRLVGSQTSQWKMLGNTIPTIFTHMVGQNIANYAQPKI